jgi:hypothetical protein
LLQVPDNEGYPAWFPARKPIAAFSAATWRLEAKRFHQRKRAKTNKIVATKALAHKLARACYHLLGEDMTPTSGM